MAKKMANVRGGKRKAALPKKPRSRPKRKADWDESAVIHQNIQPVET